MANYNLNDVARLKHVAALATLTKEKLGETIKYVSTSGNTINFYTTADGTGTAAFSVDFPEEIFLDQTGTTLVENFSWSALTYPNSTNPNLNGKTVLVLAVKGDAQTPTVKYSFVDVSKLIDTYTAADNSITISGYTVAVKVSSTTGNLLEVKNDGIFVGSDSSKVDKVTNATQGNIAVFGASGAIADGGLTLADVSYSAATSLTSGLMTAADKIKLDGIDANANNFTLPTASDTVKGGVKIGTGFSMDGDTLNCTITGGISYAVATSLESGLMSAGDKEKLDSFSIASDSAVAEMLSDVFGAGSVSSILGISSISYSEATSITSGLMSSTDKAKLDNFTIASDSAVVSMLNNVFGAGSIDSITR